MPTPPFLLASCSFRSGVEDDWTRKDGDGMWSRRREERAFVKESMEVGFSTSFAGIFILMAFSLRAGYPDDILILCLETREVMRNFALIFRSCPLSRDGRNWVMLQKETF